MRCPFCNGTDTQVKDSRPAEDGACVRRRRECHDCGARFTTFERVQLRELSVVKSTGKKVPFDRDKLMRSVLIATRKRDVDPEKAELVVSGIVRKLEATGESEIDSSAIGECVMAALANLDDIAYVRYASVYKNFREVRDFEHILDTLGSDGRKGRAEE